MNLIKCMECGREFQFLPPHLRKTHQMTGSEYRDRHEIRAGEPLAAVEYSAKHRDKMIRLRALGAITNEHLPQAVAAARDAGRGEKIPSDRAAQAAIAKRIGPKQTLPPGTKGKRGRDMDRARNYLRKWRALRSEKCK